MVWARTGCLAFVFGSVLAMAGCCYHAAQSGRERDFALGDAGCDANARSRCFDYAYRRRPASCADTGENTAGVRPASGSVAPSSELPIYVLPPNSVSNATLIGPNPLPQAGPWQKEDGR